MGCGFSAWALTTVRAAQPSATSRVNGFMFAPPVALPRAEPGAGSIFREQTGEPLTSQSLKCPPHPRTVTRPVSGLTSGADPCRIAFPRRHQWLRSGSEHLCMPEDSVLLDHRCGGSAGMVGSQRSRRTGFPLFRPDGRKHLARAATLTIRHSGCQIGFGRAPTFRPGRAAGRAA